MSEEEKIKLKNIVTRVRSANSKIDRVIEAVDKLEVTMAANISINDKAFEEEAITSVDKALRETSTVLKSNVIYTINRRVNN